MAADEAAAARDVPRRHAFWWRVAFVLYALLLVTMTHWPGLDIGRPGEPPPDKFVHMYAFGLLAGFLWMTGWVRTPGRLLVIGLSWAALDEWTQSLPVLRRTSSWTDMAASMGGVVVAWSWIAALRPVGGPLNRAQRRLNALLAGEVFSSVAARRGCSAWTALTVAVVLTMFGLVRYWPQVMAALPSPVPAIIYGAVQAALLGTSLWVWLVIWRKVTAEARSSRRCPSCGFPCADREPDSRGYVVCPRCKAPTHVITWRPMPSMNSVDIRRLARKPLLNAAVLLLVIYVGVVAVYLVGRSGHVGTAGQRVASFITRLPRDFTMTMDAVILLGAAALVAHGYRVRFARRFDNQGVTCFTCGHDLRATPTHGGLGACGECGTVFAAPESTAAQPHSTTGSPTRTSLQATDATPHSAGVPDPRCPMPND